MRRWVVGKEGREGLDIDDEMIIVIRSMFVLLAVRSQFIPLSLDIL